MSAKDAGPTMWPWTVIPLMTLTPDFKVLFWNIHISGLGGQWKWKEMDLSWSLMTMTLTFRWPWEGGGVGVGWGVNELDRNRGVFRCQQATDIFSFANFHIEILFVVLNWKHCRMNFYHYDVNNISFQVDQLTMEMLSIWFPWDIYQTHDMLSK